MDDHYSRNGERPLNYTDDDVWADHKEGWVPWVLCLWVAIIIISAFVVI